VIVNGFPSAFGNLLSIFHLSVLFLFVEIFSVGVNYTKKVPGGELRKKLER
jgi:hypothetical protein